MFAQSVGPTSPLRTTNFPVCRRQAFPRTAIAAAYQDPQSVTTTRFARPAGAPHSFQRVFLHVRQLMERSLDKNPASSSRANREPVRATPRRLRQSPLGGTCSRASLTRRTTNSTARDPVVRATYRCLGLMAGPIVARQHFWDKTAKNRPADSQYRPRSGTPAKCSCRQPIRTCGTRSFV